MGPDELLKEIRLVASETIAMQAILVHVGRRLIADPSLKAAVRAGFYDAANLIEDHTIAAGRNVPPEHLANSLKIIEQLRRAVLGDHDKPKHGV